MTTPTELLALCMELNKPDFPVFFNYSGHVEPCSFSLHVSPGGWQKESIYFALNFNYERCTDAHSWLLNEHKKHRSTQNEVDGNAD